MKGGPLTAEKSYIARTGGLKARDYPGQVLFAICANSAPPGTNHRCEKGIRTVGPGAFFIPSVHPYK